MDPIRRIMIEREEQRQLLLDIEAQAARVMAEVRNLLAQIHAGRSTQGSPS